MMVVATSASFLMAFVPFSYSRPFLSKRYRNMVAAMLVVVLDLPLRLATSL